MEYRIAIEDMHCEQCASNIERYVNNQPGVQQADVDYEAAEARLEVAPDTDVTAIVEAIDSMGYDASNVEP